MGQGFRRRSGARGSLPGEPSVILDPDYISAVAAHVEEENETSLSRAYELGREALAQGLGILDVLSLHDAVQRELVFAASDAERPRVAAAVSNFFREFLSPFEMSF